MQKKETLETAIKDTIYKLRTPLVVIKAGVSSVKDYMPILVKAYELGKKNGFELEDIPLEKLQMLERLLEHSEKEVHSANDYVNVLRKYLESNR